jgi:hypothetical protein
MRWSFKPVLEGQARGAKEARRPTRTAPACGCDPARGRCCGVAACARGGVCCGADMGGGRDPHRYSREDGSACRKKIRLASWSHGAGAARHPVRHRTRDSPAYKPLTRARAAQPRPQHPAPRGAARRAQNSHSASNHELWVRYAGDMVPPTACTYKTSRLRAMRPRKGTIRRGSSPAAAVIQAAGPRRARAENAAMCRRFTQCACQRLRHRLTQSPAQLLGTPAPREKEALKAGIPSTRRRLRWHGSQPPLG